MLSSSPQGVMNGLRFEVLRLRSDLALSLGLATVAKTSASASADGQLETVPGVDDGAVLSLLSLPKGKRTFLRAVPMLPPESRIAAVTAGMRSLPYFVASAVAGKDADEADAALATALAGWVKTLSPPAPAAAANGASKASVLGMLTSWLTELATSHSGGTIRALLNHPGASEVISALLFRGEAEATAAGTEAAAATERARKQKEDAIASSSSADNSSDSSDEAAAAAKVAAVAAADAALAAAAAIEAEVAAWKATTEALGRAFVDSDSPAQ